MSVTILVFMELALQYLEENRDYPSCWGHNPCFYGISFAISFHKITRLATQRHNPCFYGISFAIK